MREREGDGERRCLKSWLNGVDLDCNKTFFLIWS